jgi:3-hydroxybutyryl-CoA dehydrogenase
LKRISFCEDLASTLDGVDLVIEAVPEILELKRKVFSKVDSLAPPKAIIATNSSSIPISRIEGATERPNKVLNIHFYPPIEKRNIVDLMGGTQTSVETFQAAEEWVKSMGCLPLRVKKELVGFCFNRVWHAVRLESLKMWDGGFVDFMDIDRAWMICTGMPMGPFGIMDFIGLDVVYQVHLTYYEEYQDVFYKPPDSLKKMVEKGNLGVKSGKGFYKYPEPFYSRPDFLKL